MTTAPAPTTPSKGVTILGREPAAWVGLIEAGLAVLLMVGLLRPLGLNSAEDVAAVMAVVSAALGVYVGYATRDTSLGVIVGLVKAALALGAVYGLHLGPDLAAGVIAFTSVAFSFFNRQVTSPLADAAPVRARVERGAVDTRTIAIIALVVAVIVVLILLL